MAMSSSEIHVLLSSCPETAATRDVVETAHELPWILHFNDLRNLPIKLDEEGVEAPRIRRIINPTNFNVLELPAREESLGHLIVDSTVGRGANVEEADGLELVGPRKSQELIRGAKEKKNKFKQFN